ncbi:MAG: PQQ-binding-like beta-propeller repeat protein [Planctomycetes bacterium]|nr:PQQ-binding-like beta-propeller repeat protein [Planctomycetota bacterium]MBL7039842.1 PQQ-binding-like beta-propeller repeat protein [Pirellulaceae bacterium]
MSRTTAKPLALLFLLCLAMPARAEYGFGSLISPDEASRFGLNRMWFTQVELDVARGRMTHIQHFISSTEGYTVHEVQYQGKSKVFSERDVDAFGEAVGEEGAKKLAEEFLDEVKVREIFDKLQLPVHAEAQARRLYTVFTDRRNTVPEELTDEERQEVQTRAQEEFTTGMSAILTPEQDAKFKQLQEQGTEAKLETKWVPEITLYVTTDRGMIHAIDAETGRTRWAVVVGRRDFPTERAGVSEDWVAVLNGSDLYLMKRSDGEIAWKRRVKGVPSAGPAITDTYVVVPTFSGHIELYDLIETRTLPEIYRSNGRILIQPIVTSLSVAWPTDRGFLYVARASRKGIRYRLEARDTITSAPSFAPGRFFASSIDGDVYCVHETTGEEYWRFTTGEPISQTPAPVGDQLYVVTDKGNLFCLKQETGEELWWTERIKRFVSASKDRLYCLGFADRLVILDAKTGGRIASMGTELLDIFYPNLQTDRIIVATKTGVIQCLRETQMQWPLLHAGLAEAEKKDRPEIKQEGLDDGGAKPAPKQPKPPAVDPFGGGANPFGGGGGTGAGAGAGAKPNPFGGGGGAGAGAKPDPFGGGGADPFK